MKVYTIVEPFGPTDGERWKFYCDWRGMAFDRFDSIDGILRPALFSPTDAEDWAHAVHEDSMIHFITDFDYALEKRRVMDVGEIVGVSFDDHDEDDPHFLGYDLIDGFCDVSLLTNWGNDVGFINRALSACALVPHLSVIQEIQHQLIATNSNDGHVDSCRIVSLYATP